MDDDREPRFAGWVHRHTELVWGVLALVFAGYGVSAAINVAHGVAGPDHSNWISTVGGLLAAVAAAVLGLRARREKRDSPDDDS